MFKAKLKEIYNAEDVVEVTTDIAEDASDAFFDMMDGIYERNNSAVSDSVLLVTELTMINLDFYSKLLALNPYIKINDK